MKTGSIFIVLILVAALVLTAVGATPLLGITLMTPQSSAAPPPEPISQPSEPEALPESLPPAVSQQYNVLFCMVAPNGRPEFSAHLHSDGEAIIVRQLSYERTEDIRLDLSAKGGIPPVQPLADLLLVEHELATDGWAVVTSRAVAEALKAIGDVTIAADQDIQFEDILIKRGTTVLTTEQIMALLRDSTASGAAVNFKIKIINKIIATVSELSPLQQLFIASKLTGEYKYDIDFDKVNPLFENISNSKITVEKI